MISRFSFALALTSLITMFAVISDAQTIFNSTDSRNDNHKVPTLIANTRQVIKQQFDVTSEFGLNVINPNKTSADIDLVAVDLEGKEAGRETVVVEAHQTMFINFQKTFPELSFDNLSLIEVQSWVETELTDLEALQLPVNFFSQRNSLWSGNKMGTCTGTYSTIGTVGCTITSIAMAGAARVNNFNPASLNSYLNTRDRYGNPIGYSSGCSVNHSVAANIDGSGGFQFFGSGTVSSITNLKSLIDNGKFPVTYSKRFESVGSTHWVVIIGYRNNGTKLSDFYYLDPWDTIAKFHYIGDTDNFVNTSSATRIYN